jgi:hypothetical protein
MAKKGIAIDVESIGSNWEHPEKSGLKCVSLFDFEFGDDCVAGTTLITFEESSLGLLRERLLKHEGIILTFRGFVFDYRVLSSRMSLEGIIEKTVDLYSWREERMDDTELAFDLKQLSKLNLEPGPIRATQTLHKLWQVGERDSVFEANQNDCVNLLTLWAKMILRRELFVPSKKSGGPALIRRLRMSDVDLRILRGGHFYFGATDWKKMLKQSAKDFYWARSLRSARGGIGRSPERRIRTYEAVRYKKAKRAAVFYCERLREFKQNRKFQAAQFAEGLEDVEIVAATKPELIGSTDCKVFSFPLSKQTTIFSSDRFPLFDKLPACVTRHARKLKYEIDDPQVYVIDSKVCRRR